MKPLVDYNFKDNHKIAFYPILILFLIISALWIFLAIYLLVKMSKQSQVFAGVVMFIVFLWFGIFMLFYVTGFFNSRLVIYDYRIVYYDFLKKEHLFKTNIKETSYKASWFGGFTIYNTRTGQFIKTYSLCRGIVLNRMLKDAGIEVKTTFIR